MAKAIGAPRVPIGAHVSAPGAGAPLSIDSTAVATSRQSARTAKAAARRDAILDAALDEFSARGFAAARLDDVAKRAGVAKGTIYLYFADKESLFQELIRTKMVPVVGSLELAFGTELPLRAVVEQAIEISCARSTARGAAR